MNEESTEKKPRRNGKTKPAPEGKKLKTALTKALDSQIPEEMSDLKGVLERANLGTLNSDGIAAAIVLKALKGDLSAANWVRDTAGEKNADEQKPKSEAVVIISGEADLSD